MQDIEDKRFIRECWGHIRWTCLLYRESIINDYTLVSYRLVINVKSRDAVYHVVVSWNCIVYIVILYIIQCILTSHTLQCLANYLYYSLNIFQFISWKKVTLLINGYNRIIDLDINTHTHTHTHIHTHIHTHTNTHTHTHTHRNLVNTGQRRRPANAVRS